MDLRTRTGPNMNVNLGDSEGVPSRYEESFNILENNFWRRMFGSFKVLFSFN